MKKFRHADQHLKHTRTVKDSSGKQPALRKQRKWVRGISGPIDEWGIAMSVKHKQALSGWVHVSGVIVAGFAVLVAILEFRIITQVLKRTVEGNAVSGRSGK